MPTPRGKKATAPPAAHAKEDGPAAAPPSKKKRRRPDDLDDAPYTPVAQKAKPAGKAAALETNAPAPSPIGGATGGTGTRSSPRFTAPPPPRNLNTKTYGKKGAAASRAPSQLQNMLRSCATPARLAKANSQFGSTPLPPPTAQVKKFKGKGAGVPQLQSPSTPSKHRPPRERSQSRDPIDSMSSASSLLSNLPLEPNAAGSETGRADPLQNQNGGQKEISPGQTTGATTTIDAALDATVGPPTSQTVTKVTKAQESAATNEDHDMQGADADAESDDSDGGMDEAELQEADAGKAAQVDTWRILQAQATPAPKATSGEEPSSAAAQSLDLRPAQQSPQPPHPPHFSSLPSLSMPWQYRMAGPSANVGWSASLLSYPCPMPPHPPFMFGPAPSGPAMPPFSNNSGYECRFGQASPLVQLQSVHPGHHDMPVTPLHPLPPPVPSTPQVRWLTPPRTEALAGPSRLGTGASATEAPDAGGGPKFNMSPATPAVCKNDKTHNHNRNHGLTAGEENAHASAACRIDIPQPQSFSALMQAHGHGNAALDAVFEAGLTQLLAAEEGKRAAGLGRVRVQYAAAHEQEDARLAEAIERATAESKARHSEIRSQEAAERAPLDAAYAEAVAKHNRAVQAKADREVRAAVLAAAAAPTALTQTPDIDVDEADKPTLARLGEYLKTVDWEQVPTADAFFALPGVGEYTRVLVKYNKVIAPDYPALVALLRTDRERAAAEEERLMSICAHRSCSEARDEENERQRVLAEEEEREQEREWERKRKKGKKGRRRS